MTKRSLISAVMAAALPVLGCDVPPDSPGDGVDTTDQAHTSASKTINAQPGTTANTGVKKWKFTSKSGSHTVTVDALDKNGKGLAKVSVTSGKRKATPRTIS